MELLAALKETVGYGIGTVISCMPGKLAYFEGELRERFLLLRNSDQNCEMRRDVSGVLSASAFTTVTSGPEIRLLDCYSCLLRSIHWDRLHRRIARSGFGKRQLGLPVSLGSERQLHQCAVA